MPSIGPLLRWPGGVDPDSRFWKELGYSASVFFSYSQPIVYKHRFLGSFDLRKRINCIPEGLYYSIRRPKRANLVTPFLYRGNESCAARESLLSASFVRR